MPKIILNKKCVVFLAATATLAVSAGGFFYLSAGDYRGEKSFTINGAEALNNIIKSPSPEESEEPQPDLPKSSISGLPCQNYARRPFAIMIAEDQIARPLSGISMADLVVEMPVVTGGITRMMAVFQCNDPEEIGSVRSARHDFIPLAMGFDAIFAHWGGSHYALEQIKESAIDNLDALPNPFDVFFRKQNAPAPHNGFTNTQRMIDAASKLGYRMTTDFQGYPHRENISAQPTVQNLEINYVYPYNIKYAYNPETNSYLRWRAGMKETDKLTGKQAEVQNIVIMRAASRQIEGQYNDVDIEGTGEALHYFSGVEQKGYWQKDKLDPASKLYFFDDNDDEIKFAPGKIWIHVVEPNQEVRWEIAG